MRNKKLVGFKNAKGYLSIEVRFKGKPRKFKAHRVAWLHFYGRWPKDQIDHINGNKSDNRIKNLREVSNRENNQNRAIHREGKLPGVSRRKNKFYASAEVKNKKFYLGTYPTQRKAYKAYMDFIKGFKNVG